MKNLFQQILSDVNGKGSTKRIALFIILLLIALITIGVTFFKASYNHDIWSDLIWTFLVGMGFISSEMFTKRVPDLTQTPDVSATKTSEITNENTVQSNGAH